MNQKELIEWRRRLKLSLHKAAEALGCSKTSIVNWEKRGGIPKYIALACAALALGIPPAGEDR